MPTNEPRKAATTMFYDGECPVCRRGVQHYQKLDWARRVHWIDFTRAPDTLARYGIRFQDAMEQLHALDDRGHVVRGMPAFNAIWSELPGYRWLAKITRMRSVAPLMDAAYRLITRGRYSRRCGNDQCDAAARD